jgi:hypothetical protein
MILRLDQPEYLRPRGPHLDFPARADGHCGRPFPESMPSGVRERGPLGRTLDWLFVRGGMSVVVLVALMATPCVAWALGVASNGPGGHLAAAASRTHAVAPLPQGEDGEAHEPGHR